MKHIFTLATLVFATACFGQEACPNMYDGNGNGTIDIEDFLGILGLFGDVDIDSDGLWDSEDGCSDVEACNYENPLAGICTYPDALGSCNGNCPADADGDGVCDVYSCGDPVSYHGYDYATVFIGGQCWFAENLRSGNYKNGEVIPTGLDQAEWSSTTEGAVAVYGEGNSTCTGYVVDACEESWSFNEYGRLYNWYAVNDMRGLCPSGWHVPSDEEWMIMEIALGMSEAVANGSSWRGTDQGTQMKATFGWEYGGNGTNDSGFTGLPGGYRESSSNFAWAGLDGGWWSSSPSGSSAFWRDLYAGREDVFRGTVFMTNGLSVRCIQDSE